MYKIHLPRKTFAEARREKLSFSMEIYNLSPAYEEQWKGARRFITQLSMINSLTAVISYISIIS